jgi:serine phosphatase RsbU (regulator of sigma subunit)
MHWMTSVAALGLLVSFYFGVYRRGRQPFTLWWCALLVFACLGHSVQLLELTPATGWAVPLAHGLVTTAFAAVWATLRSLGGRRTPLALFAAPGVLALLTSLALDHRVHGWSGEAISIAAVSVLMLLAAYELWRLEHDFPWAKLYVLACAALGIYLAGRFAFALLDGFDDGAFVTRLYDHPSTVAMFVMMLMASFQLSSEALEQYAALVKERTQLSSARDTAALQEKAEKTRAQLDEAARVQSNLLPHAAPDVPGYEMAGACIPSGQGSGDFFDWQPTRDGIALTLGDVMGKGMGAAMIAATMRAALRAGVAHQSSTALMRSVDSVIEPDLAVNDSFVTLFHARLSPEDGLLDVIDAGHGLALIVRADGTRARVLGGNLPLGVLPSQDWASTAQRLYEGDLLVAFSDGLLDLFDGREDQFERAVHAALTEGRSPQDVVKAVRRLARGRRLTDDVTVIAIRRTSDVAAPTDATAPDQDLATTA